MRKFFFLLLLSGSSYFSHAQHLHKDFGIKAGLNVANLKLENSSSTDARLAFYLGALAHLHFAQHWAVQPELVWSSQGAKQTISGTDYKLLLSYLNLPVLFQYMTGTGFRVQTGPQFGFCIGAKSKVGSNKTDIKDNIKTFDLSWAFGASYVTNSGFGIDARYNLGLTDINDAGGDFVKNRVGQFGVFYQFNVSKMGTKHIK